MKTSMKVSTYLTVTAVLLTLALADPATAKKLVPFRGSVQELKSTSFRVRHYWLMGAARESPAILASLR